MGYEDDWEQKQKLKKEKKLCYRFNLFGNEKKGKQYEDNYQ